MARPRLASGALRSRTLSASSRSSPRCMLYLHGKQKGYRVCSGCSSAGPHAQQHHGQRHTEELALIRAGLFTVCPESDPGRSLPLLLQPGWAAYHHSRAAMHGH